MKNILFIHQSSDLYGSDKTLLFLVNSIRNEMKPIVVLPNKGPLYEELIKINVEVLVLPVIKVSRSFFQLSNLLKLPFNIYRSIYTLKKKLGLRNIHIIHSNTLAVFLGAFYAKIYGIKHIWHVHEIIKYPKLAAKFYPKLVYFFSDIVVFNSQASAKQLYSFKPKLKNKSVVIHNGLDRETNFIDEKLIQKKRKEIYSNIKKTSIILSLVGRINKHKGHNLLLDVFEELKEKYDNIYLLFIGSTIKSQDFLLAELKNKIKEKKIENLVKVIGFQKDIWFYYDIIDVLIVPTLDPEPFGLVAVEGMLSKKPVIASNHGGLIEIIKHKKTGLLFEPNNHNALKDAIEYILINKQLIDEYGINGELRAKKEFSLSAYIGKFKNLYKTI